MGDVVFKMSADEQRAVAGFLRVARVEKKVDDGLKGIAADANSAKAALAAAGHKGAAAFERQERAAERAKIAAEKHRKTAVSAFERMATAAGGVTAAVGAIKNMLGTMNAEADRGAQKLLGLQGSMKSLLQVSGSLGEFSLNRRLAENISKQEGISQEQSRGFIFAARSQGIDSAKDLQFLSSLARATQDPAAFVGATGLLQKQFGGGSAAEIVNALFAGGKKSPVSPEKFAGVAGISGISVQRAGGSLDELIGLTSVLSGATKSPETAADRIKEVGAVLARMAAPQFKKRLSDEDQASLAALEGEVGGIETEEAGIRERQKRMRRGFEDRAVSIRAMKRDAQGPAREALEADRRAFRRGTEDQLDRLTKQREGKRRQIDEVRGRTQFIREAPQLAGEGFMGKVEAFMQLPEQARLAVSTGSKEFAEGIELISKNKAAIGQAIQFSREARSKAGTAASLVRTKIREIAERDPAMVATREDARASVSLEIEEQKKLGIGRLETQTLRKRGLAQSLAAGESGGLRALRRAWGWGAEWLGGTTMGVANLSGQQRETVWSTEDRIEYSRSIAEGAAFIARNQMIIGPSGRNAGDESAGRRQKQGGEE